MVFGITLVKNEADIVADTVRHMLRHVDHVLALDNGSTDGTRRLLEQVGAEVRPDPDPAHYQSRKMTALAHEAAEMGAEWVIPFDADEVWLGWKQMRIADILAGLPAEALIVEAQMLDHVATAADGDGRPVRQMVWRRAAALPLRKVAARARPSLTIHEGNHSASFDGVRHPLRVTDVLQVRHFPYRSAEQMIRKARQGAAALAATDLPEAIGKHWRDYGRLTDEQITEVFYEHFFSADPEADGLVCDPCPLRS